MGARIEGLGGTTLTIEGVEELHSTDFRNIPDRIETGTFLTGCAMAGGKITALNCDPRHISSLISKLEEAGAKVTSAASSVTIEAPEQIAPVQRFNRAVSGFSNGYASSVDCPDVAR